MKQILLFVLALLPMVVSAYDMSNNGIYYNIKSDGSLEVTGLASRTIVADIPSSIKIDGTKYRVTSIGAYAFEGRSDITYLSIPYSIKSIGEYAFRGCGSSMTVNIADPESWCKMQLGNEHASPLSSAGKMLVHDKETDRIDIPEEVTSIGAFTFYQCSCLKSLSIPGSVTSIGSSAFEDCDYLTSLTLSNGLKSIGGSAFEGCKRLSTLTIPGTVNTIKVNAFNNCSGLTSVASEIVNPFEISNNVFNGIPSYAQLIVPKGKKSAYQYTAGWNQFTNIVEVGGVGYEFDVDGIYYKINMNNTVSVVSGSTKYFGDIVIPSKVTYFGTTYNVTSIGWDAFSGCSDLTSVTIPNSVIGIGQWAFENCSGLTSVTIPNDCWIGKEAFWDCRGLTSITLSGGVMCEDGAFWGCYDLNAVHISDLEEFLNCSFELEEYPGSNPLYCAHHLYLNGEEIKDLVIPNTITRIGNCALMGWSALTSVAIPSSVTDIGRYAFYACSGLTSITIPNGVISIGDDAFAWCSGLTSVTIPSSVTSIGSDVFYNCSSLTSIISEIENPFAIDNSVFDNIPSNATLIVPKGKKSIYQYTAGWNQFTNIVENVGIGDVIEANGICYRIGENNTVAVTYNSNKFYGDLMIPDQIAYNGVNYTVTSIEYWAFDYGVSYNIKSVTIPSTITSIGSEAFIDQYGITSIRSLNVNPPSCFSSSFSGVDRNNSVLWVPLGSLAAYKVADGWKLFQNIRELIPGDANLDGKVDATDIVETVNAVKGSPSESFFLPNADQNDNKQADSNDVRVIVNIIMGR